MKVPVQQSLARMAGMALMAVLVAAPMAAQTGVACGPAGTHGSMQMPPPPPGGMGPRQQMEMMQQKLNLSPEQMTQVQAVFAEHRSKMEAMRSDTTLAPADRRMKMMGMRKAEEEKMMAILTPDQQTKFKALMQERRETMRSHRPGGGMSGEQMPPAGSPQPQR